MARIHRRTIQKRAFNDLDNHDGVVTLLEQDILACVSKWILESITILKSRDITLPTNVHLVKAMLFSVVMYGYESWAVKKAEH